MKRIQNIAHTVIALVAVLLGVACENATDPKLTSQQSNIEKYLEGSHKPRLIVEDEIGDSLDENPEFYSRWGLDIYRYIATYYNEGRNEKPEVRSNSTVELVYTAYIFKSGAPTVSDMFATNDADSLDKLKQEGLDAEYEWSTEPLKVKMGTENLLPSIETALVGCREGDSVEIYLTYEAAYGKHYIGEIPPYSSLVWFIDIVSVTK